MKKSRFSDQYLAISQKLLKIDADMLQVIVQASNAPSIHVTFIAKDISQKGRSLGKRKWGLKIGTNGDFSSFGTNSAETMQGRWDRLQLILQGPILVLSMRHLARLRQGRPQGRRKWGLKIGKNGDCWIFPIKYRRNRAK